MLTQSDVAYVTFNTLGMNVLITILTAKGGLYSKAYTTLEESDTLGIYLAFCLVNIAPNIAILTAYH